MQHLPRFFHGGRQNGAASTAQARHVPGNALLLGDSRQRNRAFDSGVEGKHSNQVVGIHNLHRGEHRLLHNVKLRDRGSGGGFHAAGLVDQEEHGQRGNAYGGGDVHAHRHELLDRSLEVSSGTERRGATEHDHAASGLSDIALELVHAR